MVKPGDPWGAALCGSITSGLSVDSLSQPVASNSEAKISWMPCLNKSTVHINLLQAPLRSSRPSLQLSNGIYWVRGQKRKGKAMIHCRLTVGNLNSRWAAATHHGKLPDCMCNLSAILATACSAWHGGESMFVMLQTVQFKLCSHRKGLPFWFE